MTKKKETKPELTAAQQYHNALHAMPSAIKFNAKVSYGKTNFKYVDFKKLRDAVLPVLETHDLSVRYTTVPVGEVILLVGEIAHKTGEVVNSFGLGLRPNIKPQDLGSEITYYKRYALAALCGVVGDADDDGNFADKAAEAREKQEKKKEKLKGPLQRTALREKLRQYLTAVMASTSSEEFEQAGKDYKEFIDQASEQWPEFFTQQNENEPEFPSFREQVSKKLDSIKREEAVQKQQEEDVKNPFGFDEGFDNVDEKG